MHVDKVNIHVYTSWGSNFTFEVLATCVLVYIITLFFVGTMYIYNIIQVRIQVFSVNTDVHNTQT